MARELYDDLRQGKPLLPIADFLAWEDIVDVLDSGVIDDETMQVIIEDVGVTDGAISFDQFFEVYLTRFVPFHVAAYPFLPLFMPSLNVSWWISSTR